MLSCSYDLTDLANTNRAIEHDLLVYIRRLVREIIELRAMPLLDVLHALSDSVLKHSSDPTALQQVVGFAQSFGVANLFEPKRSVTALFYYVRCGSYPELVVNVCNLIDDHIGVPVPILNHIISQGISVEWVFSLFLRSGSIPTLDTFVDMFRLYRTCLPSISHLLEVITSFTALSGNDRFQTLPPDVYTQLLETVILTAPNLGVTLDVFYQTRSCTILQASHFLLILHAITRSADAAQYSSIFSHDTTLKPIEVAWEYIAFESHLASFPKVAAHHHLLQECVRLGNKKFFGDIFFALPRDFIVRYYNVEGDDGVRKVYDAIAENPAAYEVQQSRFVRPVL